jgi:hypothetical protein
MRIGLISDTHDFFDPRLPELFSGVDHILHAGDICRANIIQVLEQIAPVTAVLGNNDCLLPYAETEVATLDGLKILVHHIVTPGGKHQPILNRIERERPDVVVFGHTHRPFNQRLGGTWYINPGYAGRRRFDMERSVALLHKVSNELRLEFLPL